MGNRGGGGVHARRGGAEMTGYKSKKEMARDKLAQEPVTWAGVDFDINTTPLQRPWVGLTAEEILDLFDASNVYGSKWIEFARAVETKLKELNHG